MLVALEVVWIDEDGSARISSERIDDSEAFTQELFQRLCQGGKIIHRSFFPLDRSGCRANADVDTLLLARMEWRMALRSSLT